MRETKLSVLMGSYIYIYTVTASYMSKKKKEACKVARSWAVTASYMRTRALLAVPITRSLLCRPWSRTRQGLSNDVS